MAKTDGKLGLNTVLPGAQLDINATGGNKGINISNSSNSIFSVANDGTTSITTSASSLNERPFVIASTTQTFLNGDNKLFEVTYNGQVFTREVFVQLSQFPDYVFDDAYKLMPWKELECYIKQNHHLPNVPSAAEVLKNKLNLGQMQAVQMEKIEEITLYLLELRKEIEELKKENQGLKSEMQELKKNMTK